MLCTRATEDADMRQSDGESPAAGEVGGVLKVKPEGRVGEGLSVARPGGDLHRQLQAPFRSLPVAIGQLGGGEGGNAGKR